MRGWAERADAFLEKGEIPPVRSCDTSGRLSGPAGK